MKKPSLLQKRWLHFSFVYSQFTFREFQILYNLQFYKAKFLHIDKWFVLRCNGKKIWCKIATFLFRTKQNSEISQYSRKDCCVYVCNLRGEFSHQIRQKKVVILSEMQSYVLRNNNFSEWIDSNKIDSFQIYMKYEAVQI